MRDLHPWKVQNYWRALFCTYGFGIDYAGVNLASCDWSIFQDNACWTLRVPNYSWTRKLRAPKTRKFDFVIKLVLQAACAYIWNVFRIERNFIVRCYLRLSDGSTKIPHSAVFPGTRVFQFPILFLSKLATLVHLPFWRNVFDIQLSFFIVIAGGFAILFLLRRIGPWDSSRAVFLFVCIPLDLTCAQSETIPSRFTVGNTLFNIRFMFPRRPQKNGNS